MHVESASNRILKGPPKQLLLSRRLAQDGLTAHSIVKSRGLEADPRNFAMFKRTDFMNSSSAPGSIGPFRLTKSSRSIFNLSSVSEGPFR
jgi:hypothetical protein